MQNEILKSNPEMLRLLTQLLTHLTLFNFNIFLFANLLQIFKEKLEHKTLESYTYISFMHNYFVSMGENCNDTLKITGVRQYHGRIHINDILEISKERQNTNKALKNKMNCVSKLN